MENILIAGAGKIGSTIAHLLSHTGRYRVFLANLSTRHLQDHTDPKIHLIDVDVLDKERMSAVFKTHKITAVLSALPYFCTITLADFAKAFNLHYFDLTEDVDATAHIQSLAKNADKAFVPQCGLAPGFINIVANDLMQQFDSLDTVKLRCGALPSNTSNALQYALTWSVDGLINEYGNDCHAIKDNALTQVPGLADLEDIQIDGLNYEAFNTSGGIGSLINTYKNKVNNLNYKTIRYPGHCEKMRFLMNGLKLNHDRDTLKKILVNAVPTTKEDVVLVFVSVSGQINNELTRKAYVKKFYPIEFDGLLCSAIQATTASSAAAIVDIVLQQQNEYRGFIKQEDFHLQDLLNNPFGSYFNQ